MNKKFTTMALMLSISVLIQPPLAAAGDGGNNNRTGSMKNQK
ncbi:MAG TPA: hypothetical protein VIO11_10445 [Candidatus Methanoperedens sp.]